MSLALSDDYLIWDNPEAIALTIAGSGLEAIVVNTALRLPVTNRERIASGGVYTSLDCMWCLPGPLLTGQTPKPGDVIKDLADVEWTILEPSHSKLTDSHNCMCRNLILVNTLADTIDIEVPTITQNASGARVNTWSVKYSAIKARVQPEAIEGFEDRGAKATATRYIVPVQNVSGASIDPRNTAGDWGRIKWGTLYLNITGFRQSRRIDELAIIDAVKEPV